MNRKILFIGGGILLFVLVLILYSPPAPAINNAPPPSYSPTTPPQEVFRESRFEKLKPGETTENEATELIGAPTSKEIIGDRTYFRYKTINESYFDLLVFKNNVLYYATENFFGDFKKRPADYSTTFGNHEVIFFDKNEEGIEWRMYPKRGVAIGVVPFSDIIVRVTYFFPQELGAFESSLFSELGLEKEKTIEIEEITVP